MKYSKKLLSLFLLVGMVCLNMSALAKDRDPNQADLFMPAPQQEQSWFNALGPGQGFQRKNSHKADIHQGVEGYSPSRRCLTCHEGQENNLHYARTELVCRDCHISSPVAGIRNPAAAMYEDHRSEKVCGRCHEGASPTMASYVIHERAPWSQATQEDFPALYWSTFIMLALAGTVFLIFLPYTLAWAWQEIRHFVRGDHKLHIEPEPTLIERFTKAERYFHTLLVVCFMALSLTGIAWMYIETGLGQTLVVPFGGYEGAIWIHRLFGALLMALFVLHILYILFTAPGKLSGPDSLVWTWKDFGAVYAHMKWVFGFGGHPVFERWTWWQKFDYWAVWWGLIIVGSTGFVLFDPVWTAEILPGWAMNVARWIHKFEAILAMGHIFVVHFFIESYRPSAFPLNDHIFHGATSLKAIEQEHPEWVARMRREGTLENRITKQPPRAVQAAFFGFGISMILLGVFLLFAMVLYAAELSI